MTGWAARSLRQIPIGRSSFTDSRKKMHNGQGKPPTVGVGLSERLELLSIQNLSLDARSHRIVEGKNVIATVFSENC